MITAPTPVTVGIWRRRRLIGASLLALAALALFVRVPAYSAFDSIYSLVWGQELLHGELPSFDAYRAPTQHPLWVALTTVLALLGEDGSRAVVGVCVAGFVALVIGGFRFANAIFGEVVAWVFALLLVSRLDYGFLAARGYIDIPFLALIVWAAALEVERPRRGNAVFALLACAGLLRPEAWLLSGAYALYLMWGEKRLPRPTEVAWVLVAPVLWTGSDWIVTGDPLYSSNYTTRSALSLGRRVPISGLPERLWHFMSALTKLPVLVAGVAGVGAALVLIRPRTRIALPSFLFVFGIATFLALSIRGFAVIDRYLIVSALSLTLFAAFALGGFAVLRDGRRRRIWALGSAGVVVLGTVWTAANFSSSHIRWEIRSRQIIHGDMLRLLHDPEVVAARHCGPLTVPNHKLVPDFRYLADASVSEVLPRTRMRDFGRESRGVAIYVVGRRMLEHPAYGPFDQLNDSPLIQVPGEKFRLAASGTYLAAYVNCS